MPTPVPEEDESACFDDPRLSFDMEGLFFDGPVPEAVRNSTHPMDKKTKNMSPSMHQEDNDAVTAILAMPDYTSVKPEFAKEKAYKKEADGTETGIRPRLEAARAAFVLAENAFNQARDTYVALQWEQHDWVSGGREQIAAHHGKDSDQYAATGRKKKSEYKKGGPKGPTKKAAPAP